MRTYPDGRMRQLQTLASRATEAGNAGDHVTAQQTLEQLQQRLDALGLRSGWAHWALAVAHDNQGNREMALNEIRKAMLIDPLSPMTQRSFDIIVRRIRDELSSLPPADKAVARLYGLLQQSGDADVPAHLAMARHLAATGELARAEALLAALALTTPASREVWAERARLARQQGDLARAAIYDAEGEARSTPDVPFAIPTTHEA